MRKLNVFNWRSLLEVDTPPRLSLTINCQSVEGQSWQERLKGAIEPTQKLLQKSYGMREMRALDLESNIKRFLGKKDWHLANSIGLFLSPELCAYATFQKPFPELAVAANSFHIKPFIYNDWQRPAFGIYTSTQGHDIYLIETNELTPLGCFQRESDFFNQYKIPPHSMFVFAGNTNRIFMASRKFKEFRQQMYHVVDAGNIDRYEFFEQLPAIVRSQKANEEQSFLSSFEGNVIETPFKVSDDLHRNVDDGYFASHVLNPLWGRVKSNRSFLEMYEKQKDGTDDCIVDELYEVALKKGLKTLFIDSSKWKHPSPFLLKAKTPTRRRSA